ncbi:hypothetical protein [Leptospira wolffii]|uniref:hypothetical protein n=1 Tax=Leptospira wolffii TaxID=409998 RepID=UPI0002DD78B7|nr:hypothetical protein [Leptospira wolffii]
MKTFRDTIFEQIPEGMKEQLANIPFRAKRILDAVSKSHILFQNEIAKDIYPYIRRIAVDFCLYLLAKEDASFRSSIQLNKSGNSRHVELTFGLNLLTASHVKSRNDLPREAIFRTELIEQNPMLPFEDVASQEERLDHQYMILTYGGENFLSVDFVNLKFPLKEGGHITFDLMPFAKLVVGEEVVPSENTDQEIAIELKNFIEQHKLAE